MVQMASSVEATQGGDVAMTKDAKSPIMHIFASFQDIVSKEDLLHLLMHIDTREALLFCFLLFCFIGFVFYFFSQKTFLSKAESSRGEMETSCPTAQMAYKQEDHGTAGEEDKQGRDDTMVPDDESCLADIKYIKDTLSREEPQHLLKEHEAREKFVSEAELSSEEAHALREALAKCSTGTAMDSVPDKDPDVDLEDEEERQARERFLKAFPQVKAQLEESIAKLYALADKVGKVHRDCTITNVVASSTGAASGILSLLGLVLAPVTAGVSLALTATGVGLGTAAGVTGLTSSMVDSGTSASAEVEASRITSSCINQVELIKIDLFRSISCFCTTEVHKALGGTGLAISKGARIASAASSGFTLLMDVVSLVQDSVHLHQGAPSELAQDLRQQAQQLEEKLAQLMEIYRSLQGDTAE